MLSSGGEFEFHVLISTPCFGLGVDSGDMQRLWLLVPSTASISLFQLPLSVHQLPFSLVLHFAHAPSRKLYKSEYISLPFMARSKPKIAPPIRAPVPKKLKVKWTVLQNPLRL